LVPGATLFLQSQQDLQIADAWVNAQFHLSSENLDDLNHWSPLVLQKLRTFRS